MDRDKDRFQAQVITSPYAFISFPREFFKEVEIEDKIW